MGLDLWFKPDVARILASLGQAASRYAQGEYREGYQAALQDAALAFGLTAHQAGQVDRCTVTEAESWRLLASDLR